MKSLTCRLVHWATVAALFGGGLSPASRIQAESFPPEFDPGTVLPALSPRTVEMLAFDMNRVVTAQMRLIRYEASAYQRKVAEERARSFVAAQRRATAKAPVAAPKKTAKAKAGEPKTTRKTKDAPEPVETAKTRSAAEPKPLPRFIAVDTVKDKRAAPDAKKVVMIWDTQAEALVGNNIYDVKNPPTVGSNSKFETYSAQYIGAGL